MGFVSGAVDAVIVLFSAVLIVAAPLIDGQNCLPAQFFHPLLIDLKRWYVEEFGDYLSKEKPHFFVGLVWIEIVLLWPLSIANVYGILARRPWVATTLLMAGVSIITSMLIVAKLVVNSMGNGIVTNSNSDVVIAQGVSLNLVASDPILTPHVVDIVFNGIMPQVDPLLNPLLAWGVVGHAGPFEAGVSNALVGPWFQDASVASDVPDALPVLDSSLVDGCICSNFNAPAVNNSVMLVISPLTELFAQGACEDANVEVNIITITPVSDINHVDSANMGICDVNKVVLNESSSALVVACDDSLVTSLETSDSPISVPLIDVLIKFISNYELKAHLELKVKDSCEVQSDWLDDISPSPCGKVGEGFDGHDNEFQALYN
ncbi:hypothetical protein KFK09_015948 [Dendrobium nobile]|uniref:EXPERA domain-containing protein n=1 Tax=Dendrobium nobile TaxID=94219 RepID=A0A8T3B7E7_DENNO|nr:hypothetical protein KFK09_015948 [Dendrobium nobile]